MIGKFTKKVYNIVALALGLTMAIPLSVFADNIKNDITTTVGGTASVTYTAGASATQVGYYIQPTGGSCDAADGSEATVNIIAPTGITANPSSLKFAACNTTKYVGFSTGANQTPGDYPITVSVLDPSGSYNTGSAGFSIPVNSPSPP